MQTNANEMKPTIVPPSYPPSFSKFIAGIVGHLLSLCELYDIDQDWLVSQVGPADLDSSQWIHLTVAHQRWVRRYGGHT